MKNVSVYFYLTNLTQIISSFLLFLIPTGKKSEKKTIIIYIFLQIDCKNMLRERSAKLKIK